MEIVSEPDLRTAEEAYAYVSQLQQLVRYLGVSSGDMEKGAMRCEVNLSLRPVGQTEFGTKVEIKNLNSFRTVRNAIAYEIERQSQLLNAGQAVRQVTIGWDETHNITVVQRTKEDAHDYRYFPEPDLPPLDLDPAWIDELAAQMPELPQHKIDRYINQWSLKEEDALVLADDPERATYFEAVVEAVNATGKNIAPQSVANWIMGEVFRLLNDNSNAINRPADLKFSPADLAQLIGLVESSTINRLAGKDVLAEMWLNGQKPADIVAAKGLKQISDTTVLDEFIEHVIAAHPDPVAQYKAGKDQVLKFLVGQVMRASRGKANPQQAESRLREKLS
jgi:aspartyl-tRNA(Asn)/glutamyl-tRNA(Gln) amidotransferase subunit B